VLIQQERVKWQRVLCIVSDTNLIDSDDGANLEIPVRLLPENLHRSTSFGADRRRFLLLHNGRHIRGSSKRQTDDSSRYGSSSHSSPLHSCGKQTVAMHTSSGHGGCPCYSCQSGRSHFPSSILCFFPGSNEKGKKKNNWNKKRGSEKQQQQEQRERIGLRDFGRKPRHTNAGRTCSWASQEAAKRQKRRRGRVCLPAREASWPYLDRREREAVIGPYGCRKTPTNAAVHDRTSRTVDGPDRSSPCPLDMQMKQENNRSNIFFILLLLLLLFIMTEKKGGGLFFEANFRHFAKIISGKNIFCCKLILCVF